MRAARQLLFLPVPDLTFFVDVALYNGKRQARGQGGRGVTVIYLDELFLLNFVVDYLLLLAAGRLSGEILRRGWLALGAAIGAAYAAAAVLPGMGFLLHPLCKLGAAVLALLAGYGKSRRLLRALRQNRAVMLSAGKDPIQLLKAVKDETEMAGQKEAHRRDGAAMVRFEMELRRRMETGEGWTEFAASNYLTSLRMAQKDCLGASFETIAAYGANAAMMHYAPMEDTCAELEPRGFLLVDSGGQYRDGTTDITRTYALGPLTDEEREAYTLVLKCHIAAARAVFKAGSAGMHIDILARETLWRRGLDYRCGTGHGVGFVGVIHEGPQGLSAKNDTPFEPGMTVTDEPGIYEEGKLGVRIENELLCVPVCETEYGAFYGFEPFTYCPIDTRPLKLELMTREELEWLDRYHAAVLRELGAYLNKEEGAWLEKACAPVAR